MTIQGNNGQQKVEAVIPSAARTVASLRDVGYDTPHAIADLVDNSIAAHASRVDVTFHFDGLNSWIRIADNGEGMDAQTLRESMRYGSARDYSSRDLGRFGFGLKTASTSQCRKLTVATRRAQHNARMEVRCLDLSHIEKTNSWEVLVLEGQGRPDAVTAPLLNQTGTVVLWEDLDRILEYKDPWGDWARRKLIKLAEDVDRHLGMVFHRFLAGEVLGTRLQMTVNGAIVKPWDPFCRRELKTEQMPLRDIIVSGDKGTGIVRIQSYVLPRQNEFTSESEWRKASGPLNWNRQQGFYIYRADRMIQSGGWNQLRTMDEHTKLARVSIDFFPELDSVFGINITKARVSMAQDLREQLTPLVAQVTRRADERYRDKGPKGASGTSAGRSPAHTGTRPTPTTPSTPNTAINGYGAGRGLGEQLARVRSPSSASDPTRSDTGQSSNLSSPSRTDRTPLTTRHAIEEAAAEVGEEDALNRIMVSLKHQHPAVAHDLGW